MVNSSGLYRQLKDVASKRKHGPIIRDYEQLVLSRQHSASPIKLERHPLIWCASLSVSAGPLQIVANAFDRPICLSWATCDLAAESRSSKPSKQTSSALDLASLLCYTPRLIGLLNSASRPFNKL